MATSRYGEWPSPVTAAYVHAGSVGRSMPRVDGVVLYVVKDGQQVWIVRDDEEPRPLTAPSEGKVRYGGFCLDLTRDVAWCTREDQRDAAVEPVTSLVRLELDDTATQFGTVVVAGRVRSVADSEAAGAGPDFVLDPALSPDGTRLAWLAWSHPNMAWDGTELWVAEVDGSGDLHDARIVAGGASESIEQPTWLDADCLLCVSDASGWSRLAVLDLREQDARLRELTDDAFDYGIPRWVPDMRSFVTLPDGRIVTGRVEDGFRPLVVIDPERAEVTRLDLPVSFVFDLDAAPDATLVATVGRVDQPRGLMRLDIENETATPLDDSSDEVLRRYASPAEPVEWASGDGSTAYGFLYRPHNPDVRPPAGELPPLIVKTHGGPTANAVPAADRQRTYWTSRGFAVLDVNYAGSVGFGRAYRERLDGRWGIADVADVATGARHLADAGVVDGARLAIRGGSAGGYLTLAALTRTEVFSAGTSLYGIADLCALAADTHKLESRYPWGLLAPWPDGRAVYVERSPLTHVDDLAAPLLLLQGSEDKVVPPNQAELMADALRRKGIPHALVIFDGEGHGFRVPANRQRATDLELSFYGQVFGFHPADEIEQVELSSAVAHD